MRATDLKSKSLAICLLALAGNAAGGDAATSVLSDYQKTVREGKVTHVAEIDNDTLLLDRNDGFYTSGLRYVQRHALRNADGLTVAGWRIGQELYTASDIKQPPEQVGPPDHPYAAWLYGGFFIGRHRADGTRERFGIDVGCLGPCAGGEWTQNRFHRVIDQPQPRGWSRQVRNEPGIVLHADVAPVRWRLGRIADFTPSVNGRFGNIFTDAGVSLLLRAGRLDALPGQQTLHAFVRADARAVGHNATLQGGYFSKDDPHTVKPKRFIGEAQIGVAWAGENFGAMLALVRRGNEIRALPDSAGAQNFLQIQFSYSP